MGSLRQGKTYFKNTDSLSDRNYVNRGGLDLSKGVMQVSVGQRTAKLHAVKVGNLKRAFARPESNQKMAARVRVLDDHIIFKV